MLYPLRKIPVTDRRFVSDAGKLFSGKASVMIRIPDGSSGMLAVRASADGLQEAVETIAYGSPQKHDVPLP